MLRRIDGWLGPRVGSFVLRTDRLLVNEPERGRRLWLRDVAALLFGFAALLVHAATTRGSLLYVAAGAVVGLYVGLSAFRGLRRAWTYRTGWLEGRQAMILSLEEAAARGLTPAEWIRAQVELNLSVAIGHRTVLEDDDDDA